MIRRQLMAIGFRDQPPACDTQQRIMGFIVVGAGEIRLVGRNQRQAHGIGHVDQRGFAAALALKIVALQFDVETVAEQPQQRIAARLRERGLVGQKRLRKRPPPARRSTR